MDRLLELTQRAEASHFWFRGFRRFVQPLVARAAAGRTNLRILDCGCGTGFNLGWLKAHGRVTGMDLTASGLAVATRAGLPLVRGDAQTLPFQSEAFDLVTSFDMLQCVPDDAAAFREIARVLKPGGYFVTNVAALEALHGDHSALSSEFRRYTPGLVRARMRDAGLDLVQVRFGFASIFPLVLATRVAQKLSRGHTEAGEAEITVPPAPVNALLTALVLAEAALARLIPMPFGSSLRVLARKPGP